MAITYKATSTRRLYEVDDEKPFPVMTPVTCGWSVQVASGNPEPDSPEDCYVVVDCGARMFADTDGFNTSDGWDHHSGYHCEAGHQFGNLQGRWAEAGMAEAEERFLVDGVL